MGVTGSGELPAAASGALRRLLWGCVLRTGVVGLGVRAFRGHRRPLRLMGVAADWEAIMRSPIVGVRPRARLCFYKFYGRA
jgi:hypothetical protein